MGEAIAFYVLAACILGFGVLVIAARNPVHSVVFLVLDFLAVAGLYILLGAQFVAAIQVLVYAGGIVVLYLFVVMLVNVKRLPESFSPGGRHSRLGAALALAVLAEFALIVAWVKAPAATAAASPAQAMPVSGNTEQVGWLLYTQYLVPFEVASMLLLVAMVGAIVLARKDA